MKIWEMDHGMMGILQDDGAAASWRIWPSSGTPPEVLVATHHDDTMNEKPGSAKNQNKQVKLDNI